MKGVLVGLIAFGQHQALALWSRGTASMPANQVVFLTKFCFDYDPRGGSSGDWQLEIKDVTPKTGEVELVIFDDQEESYPDDSAASDFACGSDRLKRHAKWTSTMDVSVLPSGGKFTMPLTQRARPRWWYVAAVDCSGIERTIDYTFHMTNPMQGWQKEFSMDHCGLISLIFVLVIYVAVAFAQQHAITRQTESARHPLRLILFVAIVTACLGMLAQVVDAVWFAHHGENKATLYFTGKFFKVFSKGLLASILVLLSQGVCISEPLRGIHLLQVSRLLVPFFVACLVIELWGEYAHLRTYTTGFIYCTRFGAALVLADIGLLAFYLKNVHDSCLAQSEKDKQMFYQFWGLLYSCAFMVLPFATFLASVIAPWVRDETIFLMTNGVHAALLTSLVVGLWPEQTQTFFNLEVDNVELTSTIGAVGLQSEDTLRYKPLVSAPCLLGSFSPKSCLMGTDAPDGFMKGIALP